jgi:hypothetical protein
MTDSSTMRKNRDFTFFFGAASGSARKALQQLNEPNVMLSYATENNNPWECEQLFLDSGGYSLMLDTGEHPPADEYIDYVENADPAYFALQDFPCEPDVLDTYGQSVFNHREFSVEYSTHCLALANDRAIDAEPVAVLQGWEPDDYLRCIERYEQEGLLTDAVGIGSVCRRNADTDIREIVLTICDVLPERHLHAFGVKRDVLSYPAVLRALDSADSLAYDWSYQREITGPWWHQVAFNYLRFKQRLYEVVEEASPAERRDEGQTSLTDLPAQ